MANQTDTRAKTVHGGNPQSLVDQMVRNRIYSNLYWKEKLAGANAEDIVDRAIELKYVGGTYGGNRKPTKFLCLVLKLLQIQPEKKIIYTFIENATYKYIRALGLFYLRLIGTPEEIYTACEKMLIDSRMIIERQIDGSFKETYMDVFADQLLREEIMYEVILPRLTKRDVLEEMGKLPPKESVLEAELEGLELDEENASKQSENSVKSSKKSGKSRSRDKEKKHRDKSDDSEDEKERKQRKKERKLKKLLKKSKKEKKDKDKREKKSKRDREEGEDNAGDQYWAKLRAEQGIK